jgi:hypothetical protein
VRPWGEVAHHDGMAALAVPGGGRSLAAVRRVQSRLRRSYQCTQFGSSEWLGGYYWSQPDSALAAQQGEKLQIGVQWGTT